MYKNNAFCPVSHCFLAAYFLKYSQSIFRNFVIIKILQSMYNKTELTNLTKKTLAKVGKKFHIAKSKTQINKGKMQKILIAVFQIIKINCYLSPINFSEKFLFVCV
jgi:ABC-type oligopeptide transport system ATPase subunit